MKKPKYSIRLNASNGKFRVLYRDGHKQRWIKFPYTNEVIEFDNKLIAFDVVRTDIRIMRFVQLGYHKKPVHKSHTGWWFKIKGA